MTKQEVEDGKIYRKFILEEAQWIDSVVRPLLPSSLVKLVEFIARSPSLTWLARALHFFTDFVVVGKFLGLKIKRSRHDEMQGGKGWRPGHGRGILKAVETVVEKRGVEIARQRFTLNMIISR